MNCRVNITYFVKNNEILFKYVKENKIVKIVFFTF